MQGAQPSPIRVGMLIGSFRTGGSELQLIQLLERINRDKFAPVALTMKDTGPLSRRLVDQGIEVISLNLTRKKMVSSFLDAVRKIRALKLDILYCVLADSVILGSIIGKLAGVRHIVGGFRGLGMTWNQRRIWGVRITRHFVDSYIVNSDAIKQMRVEREKLASHCIETIPNGLDTSLFPFVQEKEDIVGMVGSLKGIKGQDQLIDAARILVDRGLDWIYMMIGDGPNREVLERKVRDEKLQDFVKFVGSVSNVADYVSRFKVLVSASAFEGMSNSIIEALSSGTPVVASNVPSNNEIVVDMENGLLYEYGDAEALAGKIMYLAENPSTYRAMQENARETVEHEFEMSRMVARMENHFEGVFRRIEASYPS